MHLPGFMNTRRASSFAFLPWLRAVIFLMHYLHGPLWSNYLNICRDGDCKVIGND